jgi:Dak1 domain
MQTSRNLIAVIAVLFGLLPTNLSYQARGLHMSIPINHISSKKLINSPSQVVPDAVEGLLLTDSRLRRVSNLNIVVRSDIESAKKKYVSIICGGGAGHEPAHAGFVGEGMLSAAVFGNVFASPSVSAILAAIRVCSGPKGVLLIVKNYTGDKLNFGMAMEKAKREKIDVRMVIVDDDCALPVGKGITGGRGVAGVVFVHKIAGAAAAAGRSLAEVHAEATNSVKLIGTLGIALTTCTVPGAPSSQRLAGPRTYEVGNSYVSFYIFIFACVLESFLHLILFCHWTEISRLEWAYMVSLAESNVNSLMQTMLVLLWVTYCARGSWVVRSTLPLPAWWPILPVSS